MVDEFMTAYGSRLVIAVLGVGIGLLLLIGILYLIRRRSGPSPFLRGGKNRQPRLQVLDAAAVDARRRIVLIRRDNVEHLVMIGGPTDVVIESGIGAARDGETMEHSRDNSLRMPSAPAEPRLESPSPQPQISAQPLPSDQVAPVIAKPISAEAPVSAPTTVREPIAARPAITEPVIVPEAPAIRHMTEQRKPAAATPTRPVADIGAASDALDAARRRVFQPAADRTPTPGKTPDANTPTGSAEEIVITSALASPVGSANPDSKAEAENRSQKAKPLGSDFDRILEEEMASKLSVDKVDGKKEIFTPVRPRRDPANPKVTGATPEPTLQNEIARIFGEMSVTRDGR